MTDIELDALVAATRDAKGGPGTAGGTIRDLADALAALRAERDLFREVALRQVRYRQALARQHRAAIEAVRAEEREKTIDEAQDELVRRDAFTERTLRILDGLRAQGKEQGT